MKKEINIFNKEHNKNLENWSREIYFYQSQGFVDIIYFGYKAKLIELKEAIQIYIPSKNIRFHIQGGFEAFVTLTEKKMNEIYNLSLEFQKIINDNNVKFLDKTELAFMQTNIIFLGNLDERHVVILDPPIPNQNIKFETEFGFIENNKDLLNFIRKIE